MHQCVLLYLYCIDSLRHKASRYFTFFMLNSIEHEIYRKSHKFCSSKPMVRQDIICVYLSGSSQSVLYLQMTDSKFLILILSMSVVILLSVSEVPAYQSDRFRCRRSCLHQYLMCTHPCRTGPLHGPVTCGGVECHDHLVSCFHDECGIL